MDQRKILALLVEAANPATTARQAAEIQDQLGSATVAMTADGTFSSDDPADDRGECMTAEIDWGLVPRDTEIARLREALAPFAALPMVPASADSTRMLMRRVRGQPDQYILLADLRRARAALAGSDK